MERWYQALDQFGQAFDRVLALVVTEAWSTVPDASRVAELRAKVEAMREELEKWQR